MQDLVGPDDALTHFFHEGVGVFEIRVRSDFFVYEPGEARADAILCAGVDHVAGLALVEDLFAGSEVAVRECGRGQAEQQRGGDR